MARERTQKFRNRHIGFLCLQYHSTKAKGLEWNKVCLVQDTFKKVGAGEESNIYYVAVTRAKQTLVRAFGKMGDRT